jgi:hypothetical protein
VVPTGDEAELDAEDNKSLQALGIYSQLNSAYYAMQHSRPAQIGAAVVDSPLALLAWYGGLFQEGQWPLRRGNPRYLYSDPSSVFNDVELLRTLTLFYLTASAHTRWDIERTLD